MRSFIFWRLSVLCGLALGISLLGSGEATNTADAASAPAGAVEESEPNDVGGVLEFRIAPQKTGTSPRPSPLTQAEIARCRKDLAANGPLAARSRDDRFVWVEITSGVKVEYLITDAYQGAQYLLVHNWAPFVMWPGTGWGLRNVAKGTADNMGRPHVKFHFDQEGAELFYYLTSANTGETLAIIVAGKVVSAPNISTAVRSQGVITGDFTAEQIDEMIKVLRKDVRPVSRTAPPPASAPTRRTVRTYLIPVLIFVLAVSIVGFFIYR